MSELRWTLLILGVVFIAALSWWERRRPRQAFAPRLRDASLPHGDPQHGDAQRIASGAEPHAAGEPWIGEAGLSDVVSSDHSLVDVGERGSPDDGSMHAHFDPSTLRDAGTHDAAGRIAIGPLEELPTLVIPDEDQRLALKSAWDQQPPEPTLIDPEAGVTADESAPTGAIESLEPIEATEPEAVDPVAAMEPIEAEEPPDAPAARAAASDSEPEIFGAEGVGAVRVVPDPYGGGTAPPEPSVEWPPEESRRILALRIVAPQLERFPGRTLRLALAAEGFLLGKFSIFHKPDDANRAVLSAASLTRPGAFELETMDTQRYGGLSLFAVLPGPKTPPEAFEELLATARNLNERLQGALQDERGGPLTPLRVASIRDSLRAEAATLPAAAAHGR